MRMPALAAALAVLALGGCATPAEPPVERALDELAVEQLGGLSGVASVYAVQDGDALDLDVTMVGGVTSEQLVGSAVATREFIVEHADTAGSRAQVSVEAIDHDGDADTLPVTPLLLELYPSMRTTPSEDARQIHRASQLPGVTRVSIIANAISADVGPATDLGPALDGLRELDLWSNGGAVWAEFGRVRIMDVPERLTNDGMRVILQLAIAYPAGQFWLEAPPSGQQWPRLYVDQVDQQQAAEIAATLGDPSMPEPTVTDLAVDFVVSWVDGEGRHDVTGVLGTRVDTAN